MSMDRPSGSFDCDSPSINLIKSMRSDPGRSVACPARPLEVVGVDDCACHVTARRSRRVSYIRQSRLGHHLCLSRKPVVQSSMKPFRVPSIIRKSSEGIERPSLNASGEPPTKKRRISDEDLTIDNVAPVAPAAQVLNRPKSVGTFRNPMVRQPLSVVKNPAAESSQQPAASYGGAETYYAVLW